MSITYPQAHFTGTTDPIKFSVGRAIRRAQVNADKWRVPLEAIARFESDLNPRAIGPGLGLMQLAPGMYESAKREGYIDLIQVQSPTQAFYVAILYIQSRLPGYGGYGTITKLLERNDRGPGVLLRMWEANPTWGYGLLRPYYNGY